MFQDRLFDGLGLAGDRAFPEADQSPVGQHLDVDVVLAARVDDEGLEVGDLEFVTPGLLLGGRTSGLSGPTSPVSPEAAAAAAQWRKSRRLSWRIDMAAFPGKRGFETPSASTMAQSGCKRGSRGLGRRSGPAQLVSSTANPCCFWWCGPSKCWVLLKSSTPTVAGGLLDLGPHRGQPVLIQRPESSADPQRLIEIAADADAERPARRPVARASSGCTLRPVASPAVGDRSVLAVGAAGESLHADHSDAVLQADGDDVLLESCGRSSRRC